MTEMIQRHFASATAAAPAPAVYAPSSSLHVDAGAVPKSLRTHARRRPREVCSSLFFVLFLLFRLLTEMLGARGLY